MVTLPVQKNKMIPDGQHTGIIKQIDLRELPYKYVDVLVGLNDTELKASYPAYVSKMSSLGHLLERFGVHLVEGENVDIDKVLIGKKCAFVTETERSSKNDVEFSKVLLDSLKPIDKKK